MSIETTNEGSAAFHWLGWALPLGRFGGISYRLNWTLMVASVFAVVDVVHGGRPELIPFAIIIPTLVVLLHAQGKLALLRAMHGDASSSMLWSLGDSTPMRIPMRPSAQFAVAAGGVLASGLIWLGLGALFCHHYGVSILSMVHLYPAAAFVTSPHISALYFCIGYTSISSGAVMLWNLVPSMIFDGGRLWRAVLWPFLGLRRAALVSIVGGFAVAVLLLGLGIAGRDFFTLVFGLCIGMASIHEWRSMKHFGFDVVMEVEPAYASRERSRTPGVIGRFLERRRARQRARQELHEEQEQVVLDRLLAKVSEQGLPALTAAERQMLGRISKLQKARSEARESHFSL